MTYQVLHKLPVVQHIVFGRLFPATWTPSVHASPVAGGPAVNPPPTRNHEVMLVVINLFESRLLLIQD